MNLIKLFAFACGHFQVVTHQISLALNLIDVFETVVMTLDVEQLFTIVAVDTELEARARQDICRPGRLQGLALGQEKAR